MIIISTKDGCHFLNDKNVTHVAHSHESKKVYYTDPDNQRGRIEDVEGVFYTSDSQQVSFKDEGSEVRRLLKRIEILNKHIQLEREERNKWSNTYRALRYWIDEIVCKPEQSTRDALYAKAIEETNKNFECGEDIVRKIREEIEQMEKDI